MENESHIFKQQVDKGQLSEHKNTNEQTMKELAIKLNASFQSGEVLDKHKKILQKIDKPILVDFNNVLVNNSSELELNPKAKEFITELDKIGQIIVITTATDWNLVHEKLVKFDLWTDKMILLTKNIFYPEYEDDSEVENDYGINRDDFFVLKKRLMFSFPAQKRVGEVFGKDFFIPLIDDNFVATTNNPYINGIHVEPWFTKGESKYEGYQYLKDLIEKGEIDPRKKEQLATLELGLSGETLKKAVEEVKKIYAAIDSNNK